MKPTTTAAAIKKKIKSAFESGQTATIDTVAASSPPLAEVAAPAPKQPEDQP